VPALRRSVRPCPIAARSSRSTLGDVPIVIDARVGPRGLLAAGPG